MKESAQQVHQEVLELISTLSDDKSSERGSTVCNSLIFFLSHSAFSCRSEVYFPTLKIGMWLRPVSQTVAHIIKHKLPCIIAPRTKDIPRARVRTICYHAGFQLQMPQNSNPGSRGNGQDQLVQGHFASSRTDFKIRSASVFCPL
jgi:hypothetical protein